MKNMEGAWNSGGVSTCLKKNDFPICQEFLVRVRLLVNTERCVKKYYLNRLIGIMFLIELDAEKRTGVKSR